MFQFIANPSKRHFYRLGIAMLCYEIIFQMFAGLLLKTKLPIFADLGIPMILSAALGVLSVCMILYGSPVTLSDLLHTKTQSMPLHTFLFFFVLMCALQLLGFILSAPIQGLMHVLGFSLERATESATGADTGFWLILYTVLAAPVLEELLCRGLLLRYLRSHGFYFSIIISGLIFSLMHGNLVQLILPFLLGCLFADITMKYGLRYAVLLHILNNLSIQIMGGVDEKYTVLPSLINLICMLLGVILGIRWLIRNGKQLLCDIRSETSLCREMKYFFTTPSVLAVLFVFILLLVTNLN